MESAQWYRRLRLVCFGTASPRLVDGRSRVELDVAASEPLCVADERGHSGMHESRRCRGGRARQARSPLRPQTSGVSNRGFLSARLKREGNGEGERCARKTSLVVVDEEGPRDDPAEPDARVVVGAVGTVHYESPPAAGFKCELVGGSRESVQPYHSCGCPRSTPARQARAAHRRPARRSRRKHQIRHPVRNGIDQMLIMREQTRRCSRCGRLVAIIWFA